MQKYVNGFMMDRQHVLLIQKNRPAFQAGKWNGIGGKIEAGESPLNAMVREFREETGIETTRDQWEHTIQLEGADFQVFFFRAFVEKIPNYESLTDEWVWKHQLDYVNHIPTLDNFKWIFPLQRMRQIEFPLYVRWNHIDEAKLK